MMKAEALIEILPRAVCLIALGAYAVCLYFYTVQVLGYAFDLLLGYPWRPLTVSILLRWVPVALFFYLWRRPIYISPCRRGGAVALAVASISLSYFVSCFVGDALSHFAHFFLDCTIDLWPAIVMLLAVPSRSTRFPNSLRNAATPIA